MKIQQVSFNGKRFRAKRWTVSHIRDRVETFIAHAGPRDIHAVLRHEFFIARQINRGHSVFRPVPASPPRSRKNAERTRQQMPRPANSSRSKQLSNMAARNVL